MRLYLRLSHLCFFSLLLVLCFFKTIASPIEKNDSIFTIRESRDFFPLNLTSFMLKDKVGKLTIDSVVKMDQSFSPLTQEIYELRQDRNIEVYWLRCTIQNLTATSLRDLICLQPGIDAVELYVFNPDGALQHSTIKSLQKTRTRSFFISQELVLPVVLHQGITKLYVRVVSKSDRSREVNSIILSLAEENSFLNYFLEFRFYQGVALGMLSLILVLHIFLYLFLRDKLYGIFLLNTFLILIYLLIRKNYHLEFDFLSPAFSWLTYVQDPIDLLASITSIWFSQEFLNTRETDPAIYRIMNVLMIILGFAAACAFWPDLLSLANRLSIYLGFISALVVISASIRSYRRGDRLALYVFFGFALLSIVPIIYIIPAPNYLHYRSSESDIHYFGEAIQSAIFAMGIADRFYQLKKEVVQNQIEKTKLKFEQEKQLQEEKERISRDLHDNIGSQLAVHSLELRSLSEQYGSSPKLVAAQENARYLITQLRDTVWAIENNQVTLEDIENKLNTLLFSYRKKISTIEFTVEMPETIKSFSLKPLQAINVYRIIQEAIQNGIMHSKCSFIHVGFCLAENNSTLCVTVMDNGFGFKLEEAHLDGDTHYGIKNMKKRASEMKGHFEIKNAVPRGTIVSLSLAGFL